MVTVLRLGSDWAPGEWPSSVVATHWDGGGTMRYFRCDSVDFDSLAEIAYRLKNGNRTPPGREESRKLGDGILSALRVLEA